MTQETFITAGQDKFAIKSYGQKGKDLLLVHGAGHNLAVWEPLAALLAQNFRVFTFDMRGHGQTPCHSQSAEDYWKDLGLISEALKLSRPILVGHSAGGYAVTAYAAAGGACSSVVVIDGFCPDQKEDVQKASWHIPEEQLKHLFRYGWQASEAERDAYIAKVRQGTPTDWLNAGVDPSLVETFMRRSFMKVATDSYLRRPTLEEIRCISKPLDQPIFPSLEIYDLVKTPLILIYATHGLYQDKRQTIEKIASRMSNRKFFALEGRHNIHMSKFQEIAVLIEQNLK
jgi:pimeloyl-ACP methyl ester carboxylesterase